VSKRKAIIVDLDGTLCNSEHRVKYVDGSLGKKDWDKFYGGIKDDKPNEWCSWLLTSFDQYLEPIILYVTGRAEKYRQATVLWLVNNNLDSFRFQDVKGYPRIYMRPDDDFRPDYEIKQEIYDNHIKDEFDVLFAIDDRKQVVDMWRRNGVVCLQCDEGNF